MDELNNIIDVDGEDDELLKQKILRTERIKNDLEKNYKSKYEQFFNFISAKNLDIVKNKEDIMNLDLFPDLYVAYNLYYLFNELLNASSDLNLTQEEIAIIKMLDYSYSYSKVNINSVINKIINEYKNLSKINIAFSDNFKRCLNIFYTDHVEKDYITYIKVN